MAHVADHLSVSALEQQYRSCADVTATRHVQTIWLLAKGHDIAAVSATVSYARRWVERLLARYNAQGPQALGDLRRRNGTSPSVLKPDLLDKLKARLHEPPPDGGLWTTPKVARWMAGELGLAEVLPQRGWEALKAIGWSVQRSRGLAILPRRHPRSARRLKKAGHGRCRGSGKAPGHAGRGLGHGRAPHRLEADPAPGLGAQGAAALPPIRFPGALDLPVIEGDPPCLGRLADGWDCNRGGRDRGGPRRATAAAEQEAARRAGSAGGHGLGRARRQPDGTGRSAAARR